MIKRMFSFFLAFVLLLGNVNMAFAAGVQTQPGKETVPAVTEAVGNTERDKSAQNPSETENAAAAPADSTGQQSAPVTEGSEDKTETDEEAKTEDAEKPETVTEAEDTGDKSETGEAQTEEKSETPQAEEKPEEDTEEKTEEEKSEEESEEDEDDEKEQEKKEEPVGFAISFFYNEKPLGVYMTDENGYLSDAPSDAAPDGYAFVGWENDVNAEIRYLFTTDSSDLGTVEVLRDEGEYRVLPLKDFAFTGDTVLYMSVIQSMDGGFDVLAIPEIDNHYTLTVPILFNGKDITVTLDAGLKAAATAYEFEAGNCTCAVEPEGGYTAAVSMTVKAKQYATYTISITPDGGPAYSFTVQIFDTDHSYSISFENDGVYACYETVQPGVFAADEEGVFSAAVPTGVFSVRELRNVDFSVNWGDNNNVNRPDGEAVYTLYADGNEVMDAEAVGVSGNYNTEQFSFPSVQKYDNYGNEINYTIRETLNDESYIVVYGDSRENIEIAPGGTIKNLLTIPISITKIWYDGEDGQNRRPSREDWINSLKLYRIINDKPDKTTEFRPVITDGAISFVAEDGETVNAVLTPGWKDISWNLTTDKMVCYDDNGDMFVFYFSEDSSEWGAPDENGDYYVSNMHNESITAEPVLIYNGDSAISLLRNTEEFDFYKQWSDNDALNSARPDLTFYLYRYALKDGVEPFAGSPVAGKDNIKIDPELVDANLRVTVDEGDPNRWYIVYDRELPKYDDEGYSYVYYVLEEMSGTNAHIYQSTVDNSESDWFIRSVPHTDKYVLLGGTVINETKVNFDIAVTKRWQAADLLLPGIAPEISATFILEKWTDADWVQVGEPLVISGFSAEQRSKMDYFRNLDRFDEQGREICYRITETDAAFIGAEVPSAVQYGQWNGQIAGGLQVDESYIGSFTSGGYEFTTEYELSNNELLVTNTLDNITEFGLHKHWAPELFPADREGEQVAFITVKAYQDNREYNLNEVPGGLQIVYDDNVLGYTVNGDGSLTIRCTNDFDLAMLNLPRYGEGGYTFHYTFEEIACSNPYGLEDYSYSVRDSYTVGDREFADIPVISINNTYGPGDGIIELGVMKVWNETTAGQLVNSVTVQAFHIVDGEYIPVDGTETVLNAGNYWTAEIRFAPVDGDKTRSNYCIREISVDGGDIFYDGTPEWLLDAEVRAAASMEAGLGYGKSLSTDGFFWQVSTELMPNTRIPTYRITNLWLGYVNMEIKKTWSIGSDLITGDFLVTGNGQELFSFTASSEGELIVSEDQPVYIDVISTTEGSTLTVSLKNFPKYDNGGHIIRYGIEETGITYHGSSVNFSHNIATVEGKRVISSLVSNYEYGVEYHSNDWMREHFTNSFTGHSTLEVYKIWRDGDGKSIVRPDISLNLYRYSTAPGKGVAAAELIKSDSKWNTKLNDWLWMSTFDDQNFPMYDGDGYLYVYYVTENVVTSVPGWAKGYYELVNVNADLHRGGETTEDTFRNPTAEATADFAVAQYTVYKDASLYAQQQPYSTGVVMNYLSAERHVEGKKVWANLPAWFNQRDFGNVYIGIFSRANGDETDSFVDSVTLTPGSSSFDLSPVDEYSEFGYPYHYIVKELLPAEEIESGKAYVLNDEGEPLMEEDHYWEICQANGASYLGYRVTYTGAPANSVTNTYTGAPYVSFNVTKKWDLTKYLEDYPHVTSIPYPEIDFTLANETVGSVSHREDVATLKIPGGTVSMDGNGVWHSDDPNAHVEFTPEPLTISVSVTGEAWVSIPGASTAPIVEEGTGRKLFPTYAPNGEEFNYFISEVSVKGYTLTERTLNGEAVADTTAETTEIKIDNRAFNFNEHNYVNVSFENRFQNTKSELKATKIWDDAGNRYKTRPESITIHLYQTFGGVDEHIYSGDGDGTPSDNPYKLDCTVDRSGNNWVYHFKTTEDTPSDFRFPDVNTVGSPYTYKLTETVDDATAKQYNLPANVEYYGASNQPSSTNPKITNKLEKTKLLVDKEWKRFERLLLIDLTLNEMHQLHELGYMPDYIKFQVFRKIEGGSYEALLDADDQVVTKEFSWEEIYGSVESKIMLTVADDLPKFDGEGNEYQYLAMEIELGYGGEIINVTYDDNGGNVIWGSFYGNKDGLFSSVVVSAKDGYTLVTNYTEIKKLKFVKYWDDDNNRDSYRPDESDKYKITLVNNAGETEIISKLPVSGDEWEIDQTGTITTGVGIGEWTYILTVPKGGDFGAYEDEIEHYVASTEDRYFEQNEAGVYELTNTHKPDVMEVATKKIWDDQNDAWHLRQDVKLWLTQSGNKEVTYLDTELQTLSVTYSDGINAPDGQVTERRNDEFTQDSEMSLLWKDSEHATVTWPNLPVNKPKTPETAMSAAKPYVYRIAEQKLNGYKTPIYSQTTSVKNSLDVVNIPMSKVWSADFNDAFNSRGGVAVWFLLTQNGKYLLKENGSFTGPFTATETAPINAEEAANYVNRTTDTPVNVSNTFTNLPKYDKEGRLYNYSVVEFIQFKDGSVSKDLTGYTSTVTTTDTRKISNTLTDTTTLTVDKKWIENATELYNYDGVAYRPASIEFAVHYRHVTEGVCANDATAWQDSGIKGYAIVTAGDNANTQYVLKTDSSGAAELKLPKTTIDGSCTIEYKAVEGTVTGYKTEADNSIGNSESGYTVGLTNEQRTTYIKATKIWDDTEERSLRPAEVTLKVQYNAGSGWKDLNLKNGEPATLSLNEANGWQDSADNLLYQTADGTVIKYRVIEGDVPAGYSVSYDVVRYDLTDGSGRIYQETQVKNTINKLNISKTIIGGDPNASFSFRLDVEGDAGRAYPYHIALPGGGMQTNTIASGGSLELKDGQTVTIYGISTGAKVTVSEISAKKADNSLITLAEAYTTTVNGRGDTVWKSSGISTATTQVGFVNSYYAKGSLELPVTKTLSGRDLEAGQFSFTVFDANGEAIETVTNDAAGNVSFSPINFDESSVDKDTHRARVTYTVCETSPAAAGYTLDGTIYTVRAELEDKLNGEISVAPTYSFKNENGQTVVVDSLDFHNSYKAEGGIEIKGSKILKGMQLIEGEYSFRLMEGEREIATVSNDAEGGFAFSLSYLLDSDTDETGLHTYTVSEISGTRGGMAYDGTEIEIKVRVSDNGDGTLKAEFVETEDGPAIAQPTVEFENLYSASGSIKISGKKILRGRELEDFEFEFILTENGQQIESAKNRDGSFEFNIGYEINPDTGRDDTGRHDYILKEVEGQLGGVTYDKDEIAISVMVTDNGSGSLIAEFIDEENKPIEQPKAEFENIYKAQGGIEIEGLKKLVGFPLEEGEFQFVITEGEREVARVSNDADGKIKFSLDYKIDPETDTDDTGRHTYIVSEVPGDHGGVAYDETRVTVTVEVTDNGDGTLKAEFVDAETGEPSEQPIILFTNIYQAKGSIEIDGSKELIGRKLKAGEFSFQILENGEVVGTATNDAEGRFRFKLDYELDPLKELDETGPHSYTLKEVKGELGGVTYDEHEIAIKVNVTDKGDGSLIAEFVDEANLKIPQPQVRFVNSYKAQGSLVLTASKRLVGERLKDKQFTFILCDEAGEIIQTVTNDGDGIVSFDPILYDQDDILWQEGENKAEFVYSVSELKTHGAAYIYDKRVYLVKVTVTDKSDGSLDVQCSFYGRFGETEEMKFVNYVPHYPKTGDESKLLPWLLMNLGSFGALCSAAFVLRKKRKS